MDKPHDGTKQTTVRDLPVRKSVDIRGGSTFATTIKAIGEGLSTAARKG
jgi:hypothetical protein